jgi:sugar phosphate permease
MFAASLSAWLGRRNVHYAWVIAACAFLTMLVTAGTMGLPGAFILPLSKEFGWSTAEISSALAIRLILFGLMGPFSAALIERYGVRRVILLAVSLLAGGLVLSLRMTQLWQLLACWGLMLGLGSGLTALVLGAVVSNRWFTKHRGLVLGCLTASSATGQLVFLPLGAWLVQHQGWRFALVPSFCGLAAVGALVLLFMRDRPSDLGLPPYGEAAVVTAPPPALQGAVARSFSVLGEGARTRAFWILAGTFFICGLSTNGLVQTHLIAFCADFGMPPVESASVLAMMGAFDFVGTILSGYLSDRLDNRWLLFWYYGLRGLSLLYLPSSTFTFYGLSIFAAFYGLDWIATVPPTVKLAGASFGREKAGIIFGWVFAAHQLGAATAAFGAGFSRSTFATYLPAFYGAGAACLVASAAVLFIKRRPRPAPLAMQPAE